MQPQLRHIPPNDSLSTIAVLSPSWLALMAATYPPGPLPMTMRLYFMCKLLVCILMRRKYRERNVSDGPPGNRNLNSTYICRLSFHMGCLKFQAEIKPIEPVRVMLERERLNNETIHCQYFNIWIYNV